MDTQTILNYIKSMDLTNKYNSNYDIQLDTYFETITNSLINKVKKDAGKYDELDYIKSIKKDINQESRKQYKIVISCCKEEKQSDVKIALKRYDFLHFLKIAIRILDIDEDYNRKVDQCKKYFGNPRNFEFYKYLHDHSEVSNKDINNFIGSQNYQLYNPLLKSNDLISKREEGDVILYSLSPKAKNLYAFYVMKNININDMVSNYNEAKVNEVLEYLIEYILNQPEKRYKDLKRPKLNSSSANYNLNTITNLLDQKANYSNDYIQFSDKNTESCDMWNGGRPWKIHY